MSFEHDDESIMAALDDAFCLRTGSEDETIVLSTFISNRAGISFVVPFAGAETELKAGVGMWPADPDELDEQFKAFGTNEELLYGCIRPLVGTVKAMEGIDVSIYGTDDQPVPQ